MTRPCEHRPEGGPPCTSGDSCPWALSYWKRRAELSRVEAENFWTALRQVRTVLNVPEGANLIEHAQGLVTELQFLRVPLGGVEPVDMEVGFP